MTEDSKKKPEAMIASAGHPKKTNILLTEILAELRLHTWMQGGTEGRTDEVREEILQSIRTRYGLTP